MARNEGDEEGNGNEGRADGEGEENHIFLRRRLKRINSQISTRQEYIADSIYTQIDFSKVGLASVDFYVFLDTDLHPELEL